MYGFSGFVEKLNIQNYVNSMGNYVHYTYEMSGFEKNCISRTTKIQRAIVYLICTKCLVLVRN